LGPLRREGWAGHDPLDGRAHDGAIGLGPGKADEIDINRLRVGQPVLIGGDAFPGDPIPGQIIAGGDWVPCAGRGGRVTIPSTGARTMAPSAWAWRSARRDLELQNAKSRLADLQAQADGAIVRAPVEGIVTRPARP
jgi:hypothetical protein